MSTDQIRADFGVLGQASADLQAYGGRIEDYGDALRASARVALGNFGGGSGSVEHEAALRKVDELVDEHVRSVVTQRTGLDGASDRLAAAGSQMRRILAVGDGG